MSKNAEGAYRERLAGGPGCLADAFDLVLPPGVADDPSTNLVRDLCFATAQYNDNTRPSFSEQVPYMLDHGVRQVALAQEVLADPEVRDRLPNWFDLKLFCQAAVVADAGLTFVAPQEVEIVHEFGPKYGREYANHPEYGYGMALAAGTSDPASETIASFIARHHAVQARNQYGLEWRDIEHGRIDPAQTDLLVALQKAFDFFDDSIDRPAGGTPYAARVERLIDRFSQSAGALLGGNLALASAMDRRGFDLALPNRIAASIHEIALGETAIGTVYRELRPDLELAPAR